LITTFFKRAIFVHYIPKRRETLEQRTIAIGDIHGCFHTFEKLLNEIQPAKNDRIVLLGDYIDRGPASKEVVDKILNLTRQGFDIIPLMGNHESMLLNAVNSPKTHLNWMLNGGLETLKSFKAASAHDLPKKYLAFFSSLKYYTSVSDNLFVHAGFKEDSPEPYSDTTAMLWSRKEIYKTNAFASKYIVHGHTPITINELRSLKDQDSNVINIDTGCIYNSRMGMGFLSAIELPGKKIISVKNIDL
jgi:serine/threonine protein phosphatase 1